MRRPLIWDRRGAFRRSTAAFERGTFAPSPFPAACDSFIFVVSDQPHQFSKIAEDLVGELRGVPYDEPRRSKKRATQPLADVVEQLLQKHQIGRESPEHTIRDQWPAIVGAANASYSHPAMIERNMLNVLASHAVVRNELFHHRDEIVARIRQLPGCGHVKALNLRAG